MIRREVGEWRIPCMSGSAESMPSLRSFGPLRIARERKRIKQKFARTDLARLTKEFVDQLCEATGGPCTYTGRNMTETHADMGVTNGEFDAFMEDLVATLDEFRVGEAEQDELVSMLRPFRGEIVEVDSSQVGTALPPPLYRHRLFEPRERTTVAGDDLRRALGWPRPYRAERCEGFHGALRAKVAAARRGPPPGGGAGGA